MPSTTTSLTSDWSRRMFAGRMSTVRAPNDERDLLRRAAQGDSQAVLALYDRHSSAVLALALRILGSRDEAEEVVQDAFVRVWQEAAAFDPARAGFRAWICTIARNRALDMVRRRGTAAKAAQGSEPPAAPDRPDTAATADEGAARVRAAMAQLPPPQREALELAYFEGLTQTEIAERTKTPLGTVKTRMLDGMRKLRKMLGDLS